MCACRQLAAEYLFGVFLGIFEQVDHMVVQQLVVAVAEKESALYVGGRRAENVLHVVDRARGALVVRRTVGKVKHVFVVDGHAVFLAVHLLHVACEVALRKLPVLVVGKVSPVLLYVHFVGVKGGEVYSGGLVLFHQPGEEPGCLGTEIIHFGRGVFEHNEHVVIAVGLLRSVVIHMCPASGESHILCGHSACEVYAQVYGIANGVFHVFELYYVVGVHGYVSRPAYVLLFEGVCLDAGEPYLYPSLVVRPVKVLPDVYVEVSVAFVSYSGLVCQPPSAFAGFVYKGGAEFQRAEQAQAQAEAVVFCEVAHFLHFADILVHVGREAAFCACLHTVLAEKLVESHNQLRRTHALSPFAHLAEALAEGVVA